MIGSHVYYVYIMSSLRRTLYIGMTNNLERRVFEHKTGTVPGFTSRYRVTRLVYFEDTNDVVAGIEREKHLKGWLRAKKVALIESMNPSWNDFAEDWFTPEDLAVRRSAFLRTVRNHQPQTPCHPEPAGEGSSPPVSITPVGKILRLRAQDDKNPGRTGETAEVLEIGQGPSGPERQ